MKELVITPDAMRPPSHDSRTGKIHTEQTASAQASVGSPGTTVTGLFPKSIPAIIRKQMETA